MHSFSFLFLYKNFDTLVLGDVNYKWCPDCCNLVPAITFLVSFVLKSLWGVIMARKRRCIVSKSYFPCMATSFRLLSVSFMVSIFTCSCTDPYACLTKFLLMEACGEIIAIKFSYDLNLWWRPGATLLQL